MTCPGPDVAGLGAYVLDALDPEERHRVEEHIAACPACAAELAEFRSLPALLDRVRPEDLEPVSVAPSPDLFARTAAAIISDWFGGTTLSSRPCRRINAHDSRSTK